MKTQTIKIVNSVNFKYLIKTKKEILFMISLIIFLA